MYKQGVRILSTPTCKSLQLSLRALLERRDLTFETTTEKRSEHLHGQATYTPVIKTHQDNYKMSEGSRQDEQPITQVKSTTK